KKEFELPPKPPEPAAEAIKDQKDLSPEEKESQEKTRKQREQDKAESDRARLRFEYDQRFNDAALAKLHSMGVNLVPVELPDLPYGAMRSILLAEAAAAFDDQIGRASCRERVEGSVVGEVLERNGTW